MLFELVIRHTDEIHGRLQACRCGGDRGGIVGIPRDDFRQRIVSERRLQRLPPASDHPIAPARRAERVGDAASGGARRAQPSNLCCVFHDISRQGETDQKKFTEQCSLNDVQFKLTFQFVNRKIGVMGIAERKTRQKLELRTRILDAARRIVMREGFGALSMRKIADAIEYSPATLYLHFESRDAIARALCAEGYAQLLASFEPLIAIEDAADRLKAIGRAYVAFGVAHPETYRLIFMEDPSYTGAALVGEAGTDGGDDADHADDKAFRLMIESIDALKADGR